MSPREYTFPVGGLDNSVSVQRQPPYTTPDAKNVRPFDVISGRGRGGTRPGLDLSHYTQMGNGNPVRLLNAINVIGNENFDIFPDTFAGDELSSRWSIGQFASLPVVEEVNEINYASSTGTTHRGAVAAAAAVTDFSAVKYRIEIFIVPYRGVHGGTYRLHSRMNATTPVSTTDGVVAELVLAADGVYSGTLRRYVAGVETTNAFTGGTLAGDMPGWFILEVTHSTTVKCYWRNNLLVTQVVAAAAGNRFGFSMQGGSTTAHLLVDRFRCQYYRTTKIQLARSRPYASANGTFYRESWLTEFEEVYSICTLATDRKLYSAEFNNKLIIADDGVVASGIDGTLSTTSFTAASAPSWGFSDGYNHSLRILSGSGLSAGNFQITGVSGGTLTIVAGATSTVSDAVWQIIRSPKVYDASLGDALAEAADGTTDVAGTTFDSASYTDWTTTILKDAISATVRYRMEITGGTGATPGTYLITALGAGSLTISPSAGSSATGIKFRIFRDALSPIVVGYTVDDMGTPGDPGDDVTTYKGSVPLGCKVIARHLGRIYFAGDPVAPQAWYACRISDHTDWDYGVSGDDQAAVAGATAEVGVVGAAIVDLCPWHRDKMMFACRSQLWLLSGDPRGGGTIDQVSLTIGLAAQGAWCTGPNNELIFLSRDGIYATRSDCLSCEPQMVSRKALPTELMDIGEVEADVSLKYDVRDRCVHIFLTYHNQRDGVLHWCMDFDTGSLWPVEIPKTMEPTSIHYLTSIDPEDDAALFAGRDGRVRRYRDCAETDEGTAIDSYFMIGPIRTSEEQGRDGKLMSYQASVPEGTGDHTVTFHVGKSGREALLASAKTTETYAAGTSSIRWPKVVGSMVFIKHAAADRPISFDFSLVETMPLNAIK